MNPYSSNREPITDPKQALVTVRIIWAALAMGMVTFAGIVIVLAQAPAEAAAPADDADPMFFYAACAMVVMAIPMGLFVRGQIFKRGWVGDVVTPQAYTTGNIIAWACCEAPVLFALVVVLITGNIMPNVLPAAAAFVMHLILWPNGRAMFTPAKSEPRNSLEDRYPTSH